jgi:hypothetical protein
MPSDGPWLSGYDGYGNRSMLTPTLVNIPRDQAIAQIRRLMGHALLDPETRRKASRETFSSPSAEIQLVEEATKIIGSESVFRRIANAKSVGDLFDCTIEIRYALVFDSLHFQVKFLPPGTVEMPDLLVSRDDQSAYVEIRRIRPPHPQRLPAALQRHTGGNELPNDLFEPYGGDEEVKKIEDELRGKFRQVRAVDGSTSIIATWSDRDFIEEIDFEQAMRNIRRSQADPDDGRKIPDGLLFCIFGRFWIACSTGQQLYCQPLKDLTEPFLTWAAELERARP